MSIIGFVDTIIVSTPSPDYPPIKPGPSRRPPPERYKVAGGASVIYRLDEHLGYAVVGALPVGTLQRIAELGYRQNLGEAQ